MKSNILIILFVWFFLFLSMSLLYSEQTKALFPCRCKEDRVLKLQKSVMEGRDIETLQKLLKELGFYYGLITGQYDQATAEAVRQFQLVHELKPDGIVGPDTWNMLGHVNEQLPTTENEKHPTGRLSITINLYKRILILEANGEPYRVYPITIGAAEAGSPVGEWKIKNKYKRIEEGPLGTRWMGLNVPWGVYGIHGTNKPWEIGRATSLGCIRLHNKHVEELFEWVSVGTPVKIIGEWESVEISNILKPGQAGKEVRELQLLLRKAEFYSGYLDATYGSMTKEAVQELESQFGLGVDGISDWNVLCLLKNFQ